MSRRKYTEAFWPSGVVQVEVVVEAQVDSGEIRGIVFNPGTAQNVLVPDKPLESRVCIGTALPQRNIEPNNPALHGQ